MVKNIKTKAFIVIFFLSIFTVIYFKYLNKEKNILTEKQGEEDELSYSSNIMKDVRYVSRDAKGNEYVIDARIGEIDLDNTNIIFLTDVRAVINLVDKNTVKITSDFGKYNSSNYDTIFTKNVIINYLENKITGEYLDFSISRNSLIISRDVVYRNINNTITADVIEMNINTKDTKIYMYNNQKKVNIKNYN